MSYVIRYRLIPFGNAVYVVLNNEITYGWYQDYSSVIAPFRLPLLDIDTVKKGIVTSQLDHYIVVWGDDVYVTLVEYVGHVYTNFYYKDGVSIAIVARDTRGRIVGFVPMFLLSEHSFATTTAPEVRVVGNRRAPEVYRVYYNPVVYSCCIDHREERYRDRIKIVNEFESYYGNMLIILPKVTVFFQRVIPSEVEISTISSS